MKYLILVGDGMGDYPVEELGGRTPLAAAATPMMDELCARGELFLNHTVPEQYPPGSDVANMSLLGYDPRRYYTGRAPLEAAAMGITLAADEIAFRCNLVTLDHGGDGMVIMRDFSGGHIGSEDAHPLIEAINAHCAGDTFRFLPGVGYRHLLIYRGEHPGFTTVPPHDHIEQDVSAFWERYQANGAWRELLADTALTLAAHPVNENRIAQGKLPANQVWLWGEGRMAAMPSLTERFGISGTMISAVDLLKGLGAMGGLKIAEVEGATGFIDTNYEGKAQAAIDALEHQDFAFVHLEGPDEAGHQGVLATKMTAVEHFDARIVTPIVNRLRQSGEPFRVVVTMDHFTPLSLRTHVADPVPTLLYDSREAKPGSGRTFSEEQAIAHDREHGNRIKDGYTMIERLLVHD